MALVFEYMNVADTVYGHNQPSGDDAVIGPLVSKAGLNVSITFAPKLNFVDSIFVANYSDDFEHGPAQSAHIDVPVRQRRRQATVPPDRKRTLAGLDRRRREEIAQLFAGKESGRLPADLASGQVRFDWLDDQIYLEITIPLRQTLLCRELKAICLQIDTILTAVWEEIGTLAKGIESPVETRKPKTVFLCPSSKDKAFARRLSRELKAKNFDVWFDEDQILVGHDFVVKMEEGIGQADFVAVVLSSDFVNGGPWAKEEYRTSLTKQVKAGRVVVLPVLKTDCDIPAMLTSKHYADFRKNFQTGFTSLLRAIVNHQSVSSQ